MTMYAALPNGSGPHPAVVIAFHVGGLDDFDRKMADQLAEAGFVAVVPDLFHRFSKEVMDGPRLDRLGHLKDADIIADMNAAVDFLTANSAIDNDRIGVTGFCMGGRIAWLMAASNPIFKCTVPCSLWPQTSTAPCYSTSARRMATHRWMTGTNSMLN